MAARSAVSAGGKSAARVEDVEAAIGPFHETLHARFAEPLPEEGIPVDTILAQLDERSRGGLAGSTGGRYFGYVTGAALPAAAIAEAWTAAVDQNAHAMVSSMAGVVRA